MNERPALLKTIGPATLADEADFRLGEILVRPSLREVRAGGALEIIEPRVMQVFVALARARGAVVSRDELIRQCWGGRIVGEDAINRCVSKVRQLAELGGRKAFEIETIARVGYRLLAFQAPDAGLEPDAGVPDTPPQVRAGTGRGTGVWWWTAAAAVAAIFVGGTLYLSLRADRPAIPSRPNAAPVVAVLPFTPLYSAPDAQLFADGVSTAVANSLDSTGLEIVAPSQSFRFRGTAKAAAAVSLGADFLIDGEVRRDANGFLVSIRLDDAHRGISLFSDTFKSSPANQNDLPDQVAAFVASSLGWDVALKALSPENSRDPRVPAGFFKTIRQFRSGDVFGAYLTARALAQGAPQVALAQVCLAIEAALALPVVPPDRRQALLQESRAAATRVLQLDPRFGDAYLALYFTTPYVEWRQREAYLQRGLSMERGFARLGYLSELYQQSGRIQQASPLIDEVSNDSPLSTPAFFRQGFQALLTGNKPSMAQVLARAKRLTPDRRWAMLEFAGNISWGDLPGAQALLKDASVANFLEAPGSQTLNHIVRALATHRESDVRAVSDDCHLYAGRFFHDQTCLMALTALGRLDEAYHLSDSLYPDQRGGTREAVEAHWLNSPSTDTRILFIPMMAPFRGDPRFTELAKRIGLFDHWRSGHMPDFCVTERAPVCADLRVRL